MTLSLVTGMILVMLNRLFLTKLERKANTKLFQPPFPNLLTTWRKEYQKNFFVVAKFKSSDELCEKAQALGKELYCPITTVRSSKNSYIVLQCRHGGTYRKANKVKADAEREESSESMCCIENYKRNGVAESSDWLDSFFIDTIESGRHYQSGRKRCPLHIYASLGRDTERPWEVRQVTLKHNHALSSDLLTYSVFRKLLPEDFEVACSMMKKGETPKSVLKVRWASLCYIFFIQLCSFRWCCIWEMNI